MHTPLYGWHCVATLLILLVLQSGDSRAADLARLSADNWDQYAPSGKEVDCIHGDIVMRGATVLAVIGDPKPGRHANMTVRHVGGAVIDLTRRDQVNDQLSAYYPGGAEFPLRAVDFAAIRNQPEIELHLRAAAKANKPQVDVIYRLNDHDPFLLIETRYTNMHAEAIEFEVRDSMRADRFSFGTDADNDLVWAFDDWWQQAYGILSDGPFAAETDTLQRGRPVLVFAHAGGSTVKLAPGAEHTVTRRLIPAAHLLQLKGIARGIGQKVVHPVKLTVADGKGPVPLAKVTLTTDEGVYGWARTSPAGQVTFDAPPGEYSVQVAANGRPHVEMTLAADGPINDRITVSLPGYVVAQIRDGDGHRVPCKVEFIGRRDTPLPNFGPDTFVYGVQNLRYSPTGDFRQEIGPGQYDVVISHGNEYDAVFTTLQVEAGKETELNAVLRRSVDTTGWISSDFHSHSSPSGDNTSSQRGRVLNLLCEHIEFAPCTEHNRVSSYEGHLRHFNATDLMATCSGMELTGKPLPVNHQNAFPLKHVPRTQDGGGPETDPNPLVQIERLAFWNHRADKVVQGNHPNLIQILGDRNLDGNPDVGFARMLGLMDVVEVHPPQLILASPSGNPAGRETRNVIFNWLQMLNQGYRIPGVVNTDAHYNFHGSGWLRNYLKSDSDDPATLRLAKIIRTTEQGNIVMTNGPFLEVSVASHSDGKPQQAIPGDALLADKGDVELQIRVQCANWLDINRVQVLVNGAADPELNFTRRENSDGFGDDAIKFQKNVSLSLPADSHLIVVAAGEGLTLGPVMGPQHGKDMPIAVTNPVFVDTDTGGFQPNADQLGVPLPLR